MSFTLVLIYFYITSLHTLFFLHFSYYCTYALVQMRAHLSACCSWRWIQINSYAVITFFIILHFIRLVNEGLEYMVMNNFLYLTHFFFFWQEMRMEYRIIHVKSVIECLLDKLEWILDLSCRYVKCFLYNAKSYKNLQCTLRVKESWAIIYRKCIKKFCLLWKNVFH